MTSSTDVKTYSALSRNDPRNMAQLQMFLLISREPYQNRFILKVTGQAIYLDKEQRDSAHMKQQRGNITKQKEYIRLIKNPQIKMRTAS